MRKIAITGGNGEFGAQLVAGAIHRGYEVVILDRSEGAGLFKDRSEVTIKVIDLLEYEAVRDAITGCEAVIHMAAIPSPLHHPPEIVFANNVTSTYHVLEAAAYQGIRKVALASSESAYGFAYAHKRLSPLYVPIDEDHPLLAEDGYGISKAVNELTGRSFHLRMGMQVVNLRLSTLMNQSLYAYFDSCLDKPEELRRVLWSYVDVQDAVEACLLAVEQNDLGCLSLNICADDIYQTRKSQDLLREFFPEVKDIRQTYDHHEALYSNGRAKKLLGWEPKIRR